MPAIFHSARWSMRWVVVLGLSGTYAYTTPFVQPGSTLAFPKISASPSTIEAHRIEWGVYSRTGLTAATVSRHHSEHHRVAGVSGICHPHMDRVQSKRTNEVQTAPTPPSSATSSFRQSVVLIEFFLSGPDTIQIATGSQAQNQQQRDRCRAHLPLRTPV